MRKEERKWRDAMLLSSSHSIKLKKYILYNII